MARSGATPVVHNNVTSLAATAGAPAFARGDGGSFDPAKFQERIEKRVDKALNGTDATQDQKKQITGILQAAFKDMKSLHDKRADGGLVSPELLKSWLIAELKRTVSDGEFSMVSQIENP